MAEKERSNEVAHKKYSKSMQQLSNTGMYYLVFLKTKTLHPTLPAQEKTKPACATECACMDEHVHTESNVNRAIVYNTHTHKSVPKQSLGLKTK